MRILFFLEPVIFHCWPTFLEGHFMWAHCFARAAHSVGGVLALAGNEEICTRWRASARNDIGMQTCFPLDASSPLKPFDYSRALYEQALYGTGHADNSLTTQLRAAVAEFRPDLIVMTSQNALAEHAFEGMPRLNIEQGPLPRLGHPLRTVFDPLGHQVGSLLQTHAERIKALPLADADRESLCQLVVDIRHALLTDPQSIAACAELKRIRLEGPTALLVTQPPDWVTYEGAYRAVAPEDLLCEWANQLPAGWIGVPTYHPGYRLQPSMEVALIHACPNLRFLSGSLAQGLTEPLLTEADGMVTISSTSAITALLLQKRLVVTGKSPFNAWCPANAADIACAAILSTAAIASTLAFLTHRYVCVHDELMHRPDVLAAMAGAVIHQPQPAEWFMDISGWTIERARSLFSFGAV